MHIGRPILQMAYEDAEKPRCSGANMYLLQGTGKIMYGCNICTMLVEEVSLLCADTCQGAGQAYHIPADSSPQQVWVKLKISKTCTCVPQILVAYVPLQLAGPAPWLVQLGPQLQQCWFLLLLVTQPLQRQMQHQQAVHRRRPQPLAWAAASSCHTLPFSSQQAPHHQLPSSNIAYDDDDDTTANVEHVISTEVHQVYAIMSVMQTCKSRIITGLWAETFATWC